METPVKTIRIKEGKPWASPMVQFTPTHPDELNISPADFLGKETAWREWIYYNEVELPSYNASFVEVYEPELIYPHLRLPIDSVDVDYPAPEGLTMEVRELCNCQLHKVEMGAHCFGSCSGNDKRVATVKFTPAEKEEKPDFEKEAERRYPVITHSNPPSSPYQETKIAFLHGCNYAYNSYAHPLQQEITTLKNRVSAMQNLIEIEWHKRQDD